MATLDEIFASMPDAPAGGTHELLIIDPDTRQIEVPEIEKVFGVITDGNAEKKYFQCPRYVGKGIDLAACKLRIAYQNASGTEEGRDGYLVTDTTESGGYVYFSWELSEKVCLFQGPVQFAVCATQGSAVVWNTDAATGTVLGGLPFNGEIVQTEMQDVIAQLLTLVEAQSANLEAVGAEQVQNVQAAGAAALVEINAAAANAATAIICQAEGAAIQVADASDRPLQGLRIFGRSTQDGTPTPDNPVEIVSTPAPVVTVCGKNLLPYPYADGESKEMNGITFTVRADGSVLVNGTATALAFFSFNHSVNRLPLPSGWLVTSTGLGYGSGVVQIQNDIYQNGEYITAVQTVTEGAAKQRFIGSGLALGASRIKVDAGVTVNNAVVYPILSAGDTLPSYERSKARQTLTLTNDLPGIPVASGGNYTDTDGQQWICDEVDLARGVYVRRVNNIVFDGSTDELWGVTTATAAQYYIGVMDKRNNRAQVENVLLCSHFAVQPPTSNVLGYVTETYWENGNVNVLFNYDNGSGGLDNFKTWLQMNPVTLWYMLETPTETPLAEAELAAFAALHSVKPTTTILNDSGAHMAVEYVADTKLYIDKKIAELITANNT